MKKIFLSYSRDDSAFARALAKSLRTRAEVVDPTTLPAGSEWSTHLRQELSRADLVLLVLSDTAVRSKWIQLELGAALGMGKQVIPIAIGDVVEADLMDYLLRDSYWIDARNLTPEEVVSRLDLGDAA